MDVDTDVNMGHTVCDASVPLNPNPDVQNQWGRRYSDMEARSSYLHQLQATPNVLRNPQIMRCVRSSKVLEGFGAIFRHQAAAKKKAMGVGGVEQQDASAAIADDKEHEASDKAFYGTMQTTSIDGFVSHVWSASRWRKALALLFYMNTGLAAGVAIIVWLLMAVHCVVVKGGGNITALGGRDLIIELVWVPMAVFFVVFFFGHDLTRGAMDKNWWLDKLCIHQTRQDVQLEGLTALPEFVARSKRIIILWSDTYFERLWCNAEVATFTSVNEGAERVDVVPLWLAPWVLSTLVCDLLSITLWNRLAVWITDVGIALSDEHLPERVVFFLTPFLGIGAAMGTAYLPMVIPNFFSFTHKLEAHNTMLKHIDEFKLASAKCSVEADREYIHAHVGQLFLQDDFAGGDWAKVPPEAKAEALAAFDRFVQTKFKKSITNRIGEVTRVPYSLAILVFMPLNFASLANVLGCDNAPCKDAAVYEGYSGNVPEFMLTNGLSWGVGIFLVYPTAYPVMLMALHRTMSATKNWHRILKGAACMTSIAASYYYMGFLEGLCAAVFVNAVTTVNFAWIIAAIVLVACLIAWNLYLFRTENEDLKLERKVTPTDATNNLQEQRRNKTSERQGYHTILENDVFDDGDADFAVASMDSRLTSLPSARSP